jgi:hypothetical protein
MLNKIKMSWRHKVQWVASFIRMVYNYCTRFMTNKKKELKPRCACVLKDFNIWMTGDFVKVYLKWAFEWIFLLTCFHSKRKINIRFLTLSKPAFYKFLLQSQCKICAGNRRERKGKKSIQLLKKKWLCFLICFIIWI